MPRVYLSLLLVDDAPFYNIDKSVGRGGGNERADVLLVQYFLLLAGDKYGGDPGYFPGQPPIHVDGSCGPKTIRYITQFQEEARKRGDTFAADGRVDPLVRTRRNTIFAMNNEASNRMGQRYWTLNSDPRFPRDLIKYFYIQA